MTPDRIDRAPARPDPVHPASKRGGTLVPAGVLDDLDARRISPDAFAAYLRLAHHRQRGRTRTLAQLAAELDQSAWRFVVALRELVVRGHVVVDRDDGRLRPATVPLPGDEPANWDPYRFDGEREVIR